MASDYSEGYDEGYENGAESLSPLVRELVAALKSVEWVDDSSWGEICHYCALQERYGHSPGCGVFLALAHANERGFE